jgi:microcystin-dependent protein
VSVAVNTKTLLTCRIPLTTNEIISSNLPLTINAQSTTGSIANTVSIYYGGSDCHLLFVNNLYPLYHQVFNPVGTIIMYAAKSTPPPGYLFCDGAWYSTSSADNIYYGLYSVILTTYGALGTTAFYVPNLKNRFPLGANSTSTLLSLQGASTGGQVQLVADNLPAHGHTAIFSSSQQLLSSLTATSGDGTQSQRYASSETINKSEVAGSVTVYGNTNTLTDYYQPYTVVNYIIKY